MPRFKRCKALIFAFGLFYFLSTTATVFASENLTAIPSDEAFSATLPNDAFYLSDAQLNQKYESVLMAANMASDSGASSMSSSESKKSKGVNFHKYLGYGTILLAAAAGATNSEEDTHHALAYSATAAAAATVLAGYLQHGDEIGGGQGLFTDPNLHALLGTLGAITMIVGTAMADNGGGGGHAGVAITGASLMAISIIDIKW